ncbi:tRNA guanosine(34) transglycosylase Tgt [Sneathiella litorea]|uniref:Queuine tRNA-ribosyltransferase n=1 Tax=Sneathiella litorea TaxID=2606216 RepID=A0A6L8W8L2_9PROT|nr:tRNA guanosine(34) transglycosylase Tgt [Sneathiella litorea]MZR30824.1 tRNA guanosine(34) transglycosylase Tgt [Sneathiella litorea]
MTNAFEFNISATDGAARRGTLKTAHGEIRTPAFMPVGTAATVKGMTPEAVRETGADILLGNTYHLMLRPGSERVKRLGGLHKFMSWERPILTDSGGFQVMSLNELRKIDENGVIFKSHIDGQRFELTPERSMQIQNDLDATITMAFDECTPYPATEEVAASSMRRSMRWAERSREAYEQRSGYGLFGIVQGSTYEDLRLESIAALTGIGFEGYAVGGLAVGEGQAEMFRTLEFTTPALPQDKPRYLMGVGKPDDLVGGVMRGIDMFDCVLPTRSGRNAQGFTRYGTVNIRNARHADDLRPLDERCSCPACRNYSRGYLHHLFKAKEMLGSMLLTWHNLHYYQEVMAGMRDAIEEGKLADFALDFFAMQAQGDIEPV